ncbi:hypothetical protein LX32DRAFT_238198 [Colletotrichum zoysiae]|uniref:Uncharacterized protein n=1 Tax=Colletotrichum zoysiae TaxID=1216348 RepID=A0AAD9HMU1_9PEZI|nr:hypothetical protein LX32DRAFT_238198 [Colletotrichum zoysiae]
MLLEIRRPQDTPDSTTCWKPKPSMASPACADDPFHPECSVLPAANAYRLHLPRPGMRCGLSPEPGARANAKWGGVKSRPARTHTLTGTREVQTDVTAATASVETSRHIQGSASRSFVAAADALSARFITGAWPGLALHDVGVSSATGAPFDGASWLTIQKCRIRCFSTILWDQTSLSLRSVISPPLNASVCVASSPCQCASRQAFPFATYRPVLLSLS